MTPLSLLASGESARILRLDAGPHRGGRHGAALARLRDMGLRPGAEVRLLGGNGATLLLKTGENRIALSRPLAAHVLVEKTGCAGAASRRFRWRNWLGLCGNRCGKCRQDGNGD